MVQAESDSDGEVTGHVYAVIDRIAPFPGNMHGPQTRLVDDLGYDSMTLMELAMTLEQTLGLEPLPLDGSLLVETVGDVVGYVDALTEKP